jgi:hypothetical protein
MPRRPKSVPIHCPCNELYWYEYKALIDHPSHSLMHWIACYKDKYEIHQNGKDNRYYPKKPGQR